ncbi:hypothetical protein [Leptospirillum ferriphilum]|uniref:hypothetical protein n=1 Tax=Leptospirillum ferriphilum TaxID=178606 RepID=UPI001EF10188|nr:hypothetical protein [Leptospirillum ferriphilum]
MKEHDQQLATTHRHLLFVQEQEQKFLHQEIYDEWLEVLEAIEPHPQSSLRQGRKMKKTGMCFGKNLSGFDPLGHTTSTFNFK